MIKEVERRLDRKQAAQFLTDRGYRTAPATLAKLACLGGGPTFESFGRRPLYREADLLAWAQARTTGPRRSTSDPGAVSSQGGKPSAPPIRATEPGIDEIVARALKAAGITPANRERATAGAARQ
jgi:hypothetical protein